MNEGTWGTKFAEDVDIKIIEICFRVIHFLISQVKGFPPEFCLNFLYSSIELDAQFNLFSLILKLKKGTTFESKELRMRKFAL
jgi:hypothetical protein